MRALRRIVEEIYRLFDRRCRTETALAKLARLRIQVGRCPGLGPIFRKLRSSDLEKALTFLDDRLLGSTSNAVERSNRRHRKMQKTIYRVGEQNKDRMYRGGSSSSPPVSPTITTELERLADLRAKGVLTEDEFQAQKARILGSR